MVILPEQVQKICFQNLPLSFPKISNQISVIKFLLQIVIVVLLAQENFFFVFFGATMNMQVVV